MERHKLVEAMQSALKATVSDRPEDPFTYMADRLMILGTDLKQSDEAIQLCRKNSWEVDGFDEAVAVSSAEVSAVTSQEASAIGASQALEPQAGSQAAVQAATEVPAFPASLPLAASAEACTGVITPPPATSAEVVEPPPGRGAAPGGSRFQLPPLQVRPAVSASEPFTDSDSHPLTVKTAPDAASAVSEQSQGAAGLLVIEPIEPMESSSRVISPPVQMHLAAPALFPCKLPPPRSICSTIEAMSEAQAGSIMGEQEEDESAEAAADELLAESLIQVERRERHARAAEVRLTPPCSPATGGQMAVGGVLSSLAEAAQAETVDAHESLKLQMRDALKDSLSSGSLERIVKEQQRLQAQLEVSEEEKRRRREIAAEQAQKRQAEAPPPLPAPSGPPSTVLDLGSLPSVAGTNSARADAEQVFSDRTGLSEQVQVVLEPPEQKRRLDSVATTDQDFLEDDDEALERPAVKAVAKQCLEDLAADDRLAALCSSESASVAASVTACNSAVNSEAGRAASVVFSALASATNSEAGQTPRGPRSLSKLAASADRGSATALELEELACIRNQIASKFDGFLDNGQLEALVERLEQDSRRAPMEAVADGRNLDAASSLPPESCTSYFDNIDMDKIRADIRAGLEQRAAHGDLENLIRDTMTTTVH